MVVAESGPLLALDPSSSSVSCRSRSTCRWTSWTSARICDGSDPTGPEVAPGFVLIQSFSSLPSVQGFKELFVFNPLSSVLLLTLNLFSP